MHSQMWCSSVLDWQKLRPMVFDEGCWGCDAVTPEGVVVFGGHTATIGWLRSRTDVYHRDVAVLPHDALSPGEAEPLSHIPADA